MGKKGCPTEMLPPLLLLTSLLIQTSGLPWYFNGDYSGYYGGGGGRDYQIGPSLPSNRAGASNFNFNRAVYYPGNRAGLMESSMGAAQPGGILNRAGMMESSGLGGNRAGLGGPECFISDCPGPLPPAPPCDSWWCGQWCTEPEPEGVINLTILNHQLGYFIEEIVLHLQDLLCNNSINVTCVHV